MKVLYQIGSFIGKPIKVDLYTSNASRGRYARLCMEVQADKSLLKFIQIGNYLQQIAYEMFIPFCQICDVLNHQSKDCFFLNISSDSQNQNDNEGEVKNSCNSDKNSGMLFLGKVNLNHQVFLNPANQDF
ncbi:hypothetical protein REPUB_Repub06bG0206700 [Reevesia pubescens]